ncbi:MAG TPA: ABC transporter permease, partial [Chitinophagaceae bacterium]|nr:ABC transporter permease [Chitinophagaceae bacterium]
MIRNYFKIACRFLAKNKTYSIINIVGLAVGTLCCLYIVLYVQDQYSYDKHHRDVNDIYRVTTNMRVHSDVFNSGATSPPIAPAMKNDFAEVKQFTRLVSTIGVNQHLLRYKDKTFYEKDAVFVDSTFFDVFSYHFINSSSKDVLTEPYTVVLLKATSDKLFGHDNPVGQTIEIDNVYGKNNFKVTAVVDESLGKSHIHANMFITMNSGGIGGYVRIADTWAGGNFANSYVKLTPQASAAALEKKLPTFLTKYGAEQLKQMGMEKTLHLQPLTSIHTTTGYSVELGKTVSPLFLYILLVIAALIQIIACI